jgi:hypothetical protein
MAATRRRAPTTDVCISVEKEGVWIYGNSQAFRRLATHMARLAQSVPADHEEVHVRWHLGSHVSKRNAVFVLMDTESRRAHRRNDFEVTFMVMKPSDLKRLRRQERIGRLPRDWSRAGDHSQNEGPQNNKMQLTRSGHLGGGPRS